MQKDLLDSDIIIPIVIAIIMFGIGLDLKFKNFKRVFIEPVGILTGLFAQLICLPLIAFMLVYFLPIDNIYKVGFVLIASAPGGTASNLVSSMLRGHVALSVSMTSFNSLGILITIPFYVNLALEVFLGKEAQIELSVWNTAFEILTTVVFPVILGVLTNEYLLGKQGKKFKKPLRYILPVLLFLVFGYALFFDGDGGQPVAFLENINLVIPLFLFNLITMLFGFGIAALVKLPHRTRYTIAVEMGLQNSALAIFIATQILESSEMSLVAVIYSSFTFFSTWAIAWFMKHKFPVRNRVTSV